MRNNFIRMALGAVGMAVLALTASTSALAQSEAYSFTSAPLSQDSKLSLGFAFSVNSAITISSLGYFDAGNDGFLTGHNVGIYDSAGNLLVSTSLAAGTGDTLVNGFRYKSITPFSLGVGDYTAAATTGGTPDPWAYGNAGTTMTGFSTDPRIFIDSNAARYVYQGDDVLRDPTNHYSNYTVYAGPNFQIEDASAVPDGASLNLLLGGLVPCMGVFALRRKFRR